MEGVGTAMGMPIPLLPLFSLLPLPPLLPLREERQKEKEDIFLFRATCLDCTAGNTADIGDSAASLLMSHLEVKGQKLHIFK